MMSYPQRERLRRRSGFVLVRPSYCSSAPIELTPHTYCACNHSRSDYDPITSLGASRIRPTIFWKCLERGEGVRSFGACTWVQWGGGAELGTCRAEACWCWSCVFFCVGVRLRDIYACKTPVAAGLGVLANMLRLVLSLHVFGLSTAFVCSRDRHRSSSRISYSNRRVLLL